MLATLSRFAGRKLAIDESVFKSETDTGHRNRAIAYLLLNSGMLDVDPNAALDTYFRQCSVLVNTSDLALMAATLANAGVNPRTGERAVRAETVPDVLTVMLTCGMYDYAGQWAYEAGLPAKSGVAGAVIAVVPGQFGIAAFSPRLDKFGNSVRAVEACRQLSASFSFHSYRQRVSGQSTKVREWTCRDLRSRRWRPVAERTWLEAEGGRIAIIEARGDLSIAVAEKVLRKANAALREDRAVIVDMKSVNGIDAGSARLFAEFGRALTAAGKMIVLTSAAEHGVMMRLMEEDGRLPPSFDLEDTLDHALEAAETRLLAAAGVGAHHELVPIEKATFFHGLDAADTAALLAAVEPRKLAFRPGDLIVKQGDTTDAIYMVGGGSVTVQLPSSTGPATRISSLGPGAIFGEMGLIDGAPRSADIVADDEAICWSLPIDAMRTFLHDHPRIMNTILANLVTDLADRLRQSNRMVMTYR
jgi:glutaminase